MRNLIDIIYDHFEKMGIIDNPREQIEYVVVGACVNNPANVNVVLLYLEPKNFSNILCRNVFVWLCKNTSPTEVQTIEILRRLKKENNLQYSDIIRLICVGVTDWMLVHNCLILLELCFREKAIEILKKNRGNVLVPLAPLERDIANKDNNMWEIITAASNYCYDANLSDLGQQLADLLINIDKRIAKTREGVHLHSLMDGISQIAYHDPKRLKPFANTLKNLMDVASR